MKGEFLMNDLTLLDLECILVDNREVFNVERNGEKMLDVDSDEIWEEIHKEKIIKAEFFGEDTIYIKSENNELILLL